MSSQYCSYHSILKKRWPTCSHMASAAIWVLKCSQLLTYRADLKSCSLFSFLFYCYFYFFVFFLLIALLEISAYVQSPTNYSRKTLAAMFNFVSSNIHTYECYTEYVENRNRTSIWESHLPPKCASCYASSM